MAISAAQVKELRETTGAGMMDAKRALEETGGDMQAAQDWLRTKGLAKAAKKSGRTAAEGLVAVRARDGRGVAVEVNAETDFVAKNAEFQQMVARIAEAALEAADLEALKGAEVEGGKTVADLVQDKVATIGENMAVRRMERLEGEVIATYVHAPAGPDMGRIGVLVAGTGEESFLRQVAMHVAAANPAALDEAALDPEMIERERSVLTEQARESGKPEGVIEKMIAGRMSKFLAENTLLGQAFVVNPDVTVKRAAEEAGATVTGFVRLEVGEGVERKTEDFAAEVAKVGAGG